MATAKQIQANRQNAQLSTGPKTDEGKKAVTQNAVTHGMYAQQTLIPGEDAQELAAFSYNMKKELCPKGPIETVMADRIIMLLWRLNRSVRFQSGAYEILMRQNEQDNPDLGATVIDDFRREKVLDSLLRHERSLEQSLYKTMLELQRLQFIRTKYQSLIMDGADYCDSDFRDGQEEARLQKEQEQQEKQQELYDAQQTGQSSPYLRIV